MTRLLAKLVLLVLPVVARAQTPASKLEFDVVSVRQSPPDTPNKGMEFVLPFSSAVPRGGFFSVNSRLFIYIIFAYKITDSSQYRPLAQSLPTWAQNSTFDLEGRAEGTPTREQFRQMVRSVLEDRFKLVVHVDTHQAPIYALTLDKPGTLGPQMHLRPADKPCRELMPNAPEAGSAPPPHCGADSNRHDGMFHQRLTGTTMEEAGIALGEVAGVIGGMESRSVVDQTGLKGEYDLDMEFSPEMPAGFAGGPSEASGPTFADALKSQLGLKLVKQTGTVNTLVVDHVEKPSEN